MKLIEEWRKAHTYWSVRINLLGAAIMGAFLQWPSLATDAWQALPGELKSFISPEWPKVLGIVAFLSAIVARVIKQNGKTEEPHA